MSPLYRIGGEVLLGLAVIAACLGWWHEHNLGEQRQGYTQCAQATSETKSTATAHTDAIDLQHAAAMAQVTQDYEQKLAALAADRDSLAQRLHDAAPRPIRPGALSAVGAPAGFVCTPADHAGPTDSDRRLAVDLEACAANTVELIAIRQAWSDMVQKNGGTVAGAPSSKP